MALLYKIMIFPNTVEDTFNKVLDKREYSCGDIDSLLEEITSTFSEKRTLFKSIFICFIKEFFSEEMADPFFDKIMKKVLLLIKKMVGKEEKKNKKYIFDLLVLIASLINIKHNSKYHHMWLT